MADREHPHTSKPGLAEKSQRQMAGQGGRTAGAPDEHRVKKGGTVGRDIPDESKERHTEIAVEAGQKVGAAHRANHPDNEHE